MIVHRRIRCADSAYANGKKDEDKGVDPITVGIGVLAIGYGLFSCVMRFVKPSMFKKLEPMKEKYGAGAGNTIHFVFYVLIPLGCGFAIVIAGLNGVSFFGST